MSARTQLARGVVFALVCVAGTASAAQLDYTLELGAEHSNNVNLNDTDPIGQNLLIPRLTFTFDQLGSTIQARAAGQIEYRDYLAGAFDNEFRGRLSGIMNWVIAPQRLAFSVEDNVGVQPADVFARNTPNNLQQTNVFAAGPTLTFRLGETVRGQAELTYLDSTASKTKEFNSQRGVAALRAIKDLSATDQLSGNVEAQRVNFDQGSGSLNFDEYNAYGRYQSQLAHISIDAALGWSGISFREGNLSNQSGVLARASIEWQASPRSSFGFGLARQFSDASQDLRVDPSQIATNTPDIAVGSTVITPQVFLENRADVSYTFQSERWGWSIAPYYRRLHYLQDTTLNQTGHGATANLSYSLQPSLVLGFAAREESVDYTFVNRRDEDLRYGPTLSQQLTPHWSWRLELTRNQRNSTAVGQGYTEDLVFFVLSYKR